MTSATPGRSKILLILAGLVVTGLVGLVILVGVDGSTAPTAPASRPPAAPIDGVRDHRGRSPTERERRSERKVDRTRSERPERSADGPVVDHRGRERPAPEEKPRYAVEPATVGSVRLAMRPIVKRCATTFASEFGGERPRIQTQLVGKIEGGVFTITTLDLQVRDLPAAGDLVACVRQGLDGFRLDVPGHRDVARHRLTYPFDLPLP